MTDIITNPEDQKWIAEQVRTVASHIMATDSFKERLKEINAEVKERFGKTSNVDISGMAKVLVDEHSERVKVEKAGTQLNSRVEALSEIKRFLDTGRAPADIADEYMGGGLI